ncbi:hypothetical protein JTB14_021675 [Gonioctena quinquepunctata]|nr:hypothetical protein JTB14_021675 [Gonioctena quinquepunctata]
MMEIIAQDISYENYLPMKAIDLTYTGDDEACGQTWTDMEIDWPSLRQNRRSESNKNSSGAKDFGSRIMAQKNWPIVHLSLKKLKDRSATVFFNMDYEKEQAYLAGFLSESEPEVEPDDDDSCLEGDFEERHDHDTEMKNDIENETEKIPEVLNVPQ